MVITKVALEIQMIFGLSGFDRLTIGFDSLISQKSGVL
jgi:hypothetical protein